MGLPWKIEGDDCGWEFPQCPSATTSCAAPIFDREGVLVAYAVGVGWNDHDAERRDLIVRAVNSHGDLVEAVKATRALVSEAAMTGFNYSDGDWAERLFANQARLSAAISKAEEAQS